MKFEIDIPDTTGLTWAREQMNLTLPKDDMPFTDDTYLQHVIDGAIESYAKSAEIDQSPVTAIAKKDAKIAQLVAENAALTAALEAKK